VACYDHIYLFRSRRRKRSWLWKDHPRSVYGKVGEVGSIYTERSRISKTQRRAAATAALLKDVEAEEKCLEKSGEDEEFVRRERKLLQRDLAEIAPVKLGGCSATTGGTTSLFPEGWDSVAGLQDVVQCMKEMVTLPLLYPEVFQRSLTSTS
jgi:SpoVK/Ycf46/Vps4 family AAA+-type ATPase